MRHVELLIFDLDGTLVDSQEAIAEGINFALEKVGRQKKSVAAIASYIGTGVDDLVRKSLGPKQQRLFGQTKTIFENYRKGSPDGSVLYPGVKDTLEYFKAKRKVIVTNRKGEFALPTLSRLGIKDYFTGIIGADDVACMKPSSCPLDKVINRYKVNRKQTIIVGDMALDILAGKEAGILTCAVTYGIGKRKDIVQAGPDFIIEHILDLKNIIN